MKYLDYHIHSNHSFDGKSSTLEMCKKAILNQINEICFTDHFSLDIKDISYNFLNLENYISEILNLKVKFKNELTIKIGLEIGEPHLKKFDLEKLLSNKKIDFIIGSIHNLKGEKLRKYINKKNKNEFYQNYFEEVLNMVQEADIDVVGHFDLIKRYAFDKHGNYEFKDFQNIISKILKLMIDKNIGLEINLSGLKDSVGEIYPKFEIVELYKILGGKILTIGSDSHNENDFIRVKKEILLRLNKLGFEEVSSFENRIETKILIKNI